MFRLLIQKIKLADPLIVYSEHDWSTPAERARTAAALGNVPITTIKGAGHFGFVDNPDALIREVLA